MKSFNFPIFHLNSWKKGKILILEIQTSHKWWNMNSISRLIHVNFYHKTHHHTDNLNFYKQVSNWKFKRRLLKFGFGHSIFVQELYYFHEDVTQRSTILTSAHKLSEDQRPKSDKVRRTQCKNFKNLLSLISRKNSVKSTDLFQNHIVCHFHEIFFEWEKIFRFSTLWFEAARCSEGGKQS